MRMVTRMDDATGEMLLWCGGGNFDLIQTQKQLQLAGQSLLEIREDKWAPIGPTLLVKSEEEVHDGR